MPEIQMPKLSDTMTEGTLVAWKKKKGDHVSAGQVLAEIETDKATMEWESPEDGTLAEIYVEEGGKVNVGERSVLGRFPLHGRFVCLNLGEHFTSRDLIALLFLPRYEGSLTHRVAQFRHLDLRHGSKGYNVTGVISLQWQFLFVMVVTPLTNFTRSRPVSQR